MDAAGHSSLESRFDWPRIVLQALASSLGSAALERSLLCNCNGSDSDFSGGACAWEHAALMMENTARQMRLFRHPLSLQPRTTCDALL